RVVAISHHVADAVVGDVAGRVAAETVRSEANAADAVQVAARRIPERDARNGREIGGLLEDVSQSVISKGPVRLLVRRVGLAGSSQATDAVVDVARLRGQRTIPEISPDDLAAERIVVRVAGAAPDGRLVIDFPRMRRARRRGR